MEMPTFLNSQIYLRPALDMKWPKDGFLEAFLLIEPRVGQAAFFTHSHSDPAQASVELLLESKLYARIDGMTYEILPFYRIERGSEPISFMLLHFASCAFRLYHSNISDWTEWEDKLNQYARDYSKASENSSSAASSPSSANAMPNSSSTMSDATGGALDPPTVRSVAEVNQSFLRLEQGIEEFFYRNNSHTVSVDLLSDTAETLRLLQRGQTTSPPRTLDEEQILRSFFDTHQGNKNRMNNGKVLEDLREVLARHREEYTFLDLQARQEQLTGGRF